MVRVSHLMRGDQLVAATGHGTLSAATSRLLATIARPTATQNAAALAGTDARAARSPAMLGVAAPAGGGAGGFSRDPAPRSEGSQPMGPEPQAR